jgi:hypothetical protein
MKISELPKEIRKKALKYQKRDGDNLETDKLHRAFVWDNTEEGQEYWEKWDDKKPLKKQKDTIVESVINQFKQRSELGIKKYGVTLDRTDLSTLEWMIHFREELQDGLLYLERIIQDKQNETK